MTNTQQVNSSFAVGVGPTSSSTTVVASNPPIVTTPAIPASTVAVTNTTGQDVMVYIITGTVTAIVINGITVLGASPGSVYLPNGDNISITYSVAPTWKWIAI